MLNGLPEPSNAVAIPRGRAWLPPPAFWCGREGDGRRVTWIELFFDLVFVAAVAQVGTPLVSDYSLHAVGRYAFLLTLIWWAWNGYAMYATRFDPDDGLQRGLTLAQMVAVLFMAANAEDDLGSISAAGFAAAYAVMRLFLVVQYARALAIPSARRLAGEYAVGFGAAALLWLVSSCATSPTRFGLWAAALTIDVGTSVLASRHTERLPPDSSHLPERFGLFTLILLGEAIVAIMKGVQGQPEWSLAAASTALSGVGFIFALWWWYFDGVDGASERIVRTRADVRRLHTWTYGHLPFYCGVVFASVGIERIIRDGAGQPLDEGVAWVLCTAVASAMAALSLLGRVATPSRRTIPWVEWLGILGPLSLAAAHALIPAAGLVGAIVLLATVQAKAATTAHRKVSEGRY